MYIEFESDMRQAHMTVTFTIRDIIKQSLMLITAKTFWTLGTLPHSIVGWIHSDSISCQSQSPLRLLTTS